MENKKICFNCGEKLKTDYGQISGQLKIGRFYVCQNPHCVRFGLRSNVAFKDKKSWEDFKTNQQKEVN